VTSLHPSHPRCPRSYVSLAEHPARLSIDDTKSALQEWKPSYQAGALIQAPLGLIGAACGAAAWRRTGAPAWLAGAVLLGANLPFTLAAIMPVNKELLGTEPSAAGGRTRELLERWGRLHAVRTTLGALSLGAFIFAAARKA
jgi:hypothetical protein